MPPRWRLSRLACGGPWDPPLLFQSQWISVRELIKGTRLLPHGVLIASMHSLTPLGLAEDTLIKAEGLGREEITLLSVFSSCLSLFSLLRGNLAFFIATLTVAQAKDGKRSKCSLLTCDWLPEPLSAVSAVALYILAFWLAI